VIENSLRQHYAKEINESASPSFSISIPHRLDSGPVSRGYTNLLEPIRKVWIHDEGLTTSRFSMMQIMARRMKAATVLASRSKSSAKRRKRLSQAKARSTIQRLGKTSNPMAAGERPTISMIQVPVLAAALAAFGP